MLSASPDSLLPRAPSALPRLGWEVLVAADAGKASPDKGDSCAFSHFQFFSKSFGKLQSSCSRPDLGLGGGAEPAFGFGERARRPRW